MTETPDSAATSHYALRPTTPVRALVLAGCCLLFGALGAFFGVQNANSVLVALGVALAVAGVALTITAVVFVTPGVYAAGDVAGTPQFTHASWNDFRVLRDLFAGKEASTAGRLIPWAVFTTPELGHVGLKIGRAHV